MERRRRLVCKGFLKARQAGPDIRVRTSSNCPGVRCLTHPLAVGALSDTSTLVLARNRQRRVDILGKHATFLFEDFSAGTCSAVIRSGILLKPSCLPRCHANRTSDVQPTETQRVRTSPSHPAPRGQPA